MSRAGLVLLLIGMGLAVWTVAVFGVSRTLEDVCLRDLADRSESSYTQEATVLPPRFECVLDGEVRLGHPWLAWARAAAVVGFPVAWVVGTVILSGRLADQISRKARGRR